MESGESETQPDRIPPFFNNPLFTGFDVQFFRIKYTFKLFLFNSILYMLMSIDKMIPNCFGSQLNDFWLQAKEFSDGGIGGKR